MPAEPEPVKAERLKGELEAVTVYLPSALRWQLKHEALDRSAREGKNVSVSHIIVEALSQRARFTDHDPREE